MDEVIDLTGPSDEKTTNRPDNDNCNIDNNLDVSDFFADTIHDDTVQIGETRTLDAHPKLSERRNETTNTIYKTSTTALLRFVPNKNPKKCGNQQKPKELGTDDPVATKPNVDMKQDCDERDDKYRKRVRPNDTAQQQPTSVGRAITERPTSNPNDTRQPNKRDFYNYHRHDNCNSIRSRNYHGKSQRCNLEWGRRNEHNQYLSHQQQQQQQQQQRQPFHDSWRMAPECVQNSERIRFDREFYGRFREDDDVNNQQEANVRTFDAQRVILDKRMQDITVKENELLRSKVEWEEQKDMMMKEIMEMKEKLNVDRVEYDKRSIEMDRLRAESEQQMELRKLSMEELEVEFETKQLELYDVIRNTQDELDERDNNQSIQQVELNARIEECNAHEKHLSEIEVIQKSKIAEVEAREEQLRTQLMLLTRRDNELRMEKATHQRKVEQWDSKLAMETANFNKRIVDFNSRMQSRTTEFNEREIGQTKLQSELDARAVAQRRRTVDLKAMKKKIDAMNNVEKKTTAPTTKNAKDEPIDMRSGKPIDYILIDSDDDNDEDKRSVPTSNRPRSESIEIPIPTQRERTKESYKFNNDEYYNYSYTEETAYELQERLLREAAEKMRARPTAEVSHNHSLHNNTTVPIATPIFDIAVRFPHHWKWKDPYAVLGLPPNAAIHLVKTQYRRLARIYHPDKSSEPYTCDKFHSISSAYQKLIKNS